MLVPRHTGVGCGLGSRENGFIKPQNFLFTLLCKLENQGKYGQFALGNEVLLPLTFTTCNSDRPQLDPVMMVQLPQPIVRDGLVWVSAPQDLKSLPHRVSGPIDKGRFACNESCLLFGKSRGYDSFIAQLFCALIFILAEQLFYSLNRYFEHSANCHVRMPDSSTVVTL